MKASQSPVRSAAVLAGLFFGLLAATLLAYAPAMSAGFVWDDDDWVTENPLLRDPDGLRRIWTGAERLQYYPLLFTVLRAEHGLWGLNPAGYHAVNIVFHACNAFLLGLILDRLRIRGAWWVAAAFALHPVHVESVAWVTELKNVLSGFFYLAALLLFVKFEDEGGRGYYVPALLSFACAMLSKTATATLPVVLVLILLWSKRRLTPRDLARLAPFFAIALGLAAITVSLEEGLVEAVRGDFLFSWTDRITIAARALWFYPWKLLVPFPLIFNYPRWDLAAGIAGRLWPVVAVAVLAAGLFFAWRRGHRGAPFCVALYVVTILPALGFFNVYAFRYSFVADHFQYLASIGLLILAVQAAIMLGQRFAASSPGLRRLVGGAIVLVLAALTWSQARAYHDLPTLWRDTLAKNPDSWIAHHNLALYLLDAGEPAAALRHFDEAIRAKPGSAESYTGRGLALARQGETARALVDLDRAVELGPAYAQARLNRANVLLESGQFERALTDLDLFLSANPDHMPGWAARARANQALGRDAQALEDLERTIRLGAPPEAHVDRGVIYLQLRQFGNALDAVNRALELEPNSIKGLLVRGAIHQAASGDMTAACRDWGQACRLGDCSYHDRYCPR